jgi:ADP-ribosylglycohydrolase
MRDNCRAALLASLIGDALALGVHWDYDPLHIEKVHGRVNTFLDPQPGSYHNGKKAGEFTHIGDQAMVLLDTLAEQGGFDLRKFASKWQGFHKGYSGYFDKATKITLKNMRQGAGIDSCGSASEELAGACRIAPLLCLYGGDPEKLIPIARAQTGLTHQSPLALDTAEFLARATLMVLDGADPVTALRLSAGADYASPISELVEQGFESLGMNTTTAITRLGSGCRLNNALPSVVHLIAKYPDDLSICLVECVMAGGDSAARGMAAGMVLGASLGMAAIPDIWLNGLRQAGRIKADLDKMGK